MTLQCRRLLNGRFIVESAEGDRFEFLLAIHRQTTMLRMVGPPQWRQGPWPSDATAIAAAARQVAIERAAIDGHADADIMAKRAQRTPYRLSRPRSRPRADKVN